MQTQHLDTTHGRRQPKGVLRRYAELALGVLLVLIFMFYIGPWFDQTAVMQPMARFIDERGIKANMYFYTEVDEFAEADINLNNTWTYTPGAKNPKGF